MPSKRDNRSSDEVTQKRRRRRASKKDIEVLATLLVAYPQVSRATFDPERKTLGLVFLCRGPVGKKRRTDLERIYKDSVEVYLSLIGRKPGYLASSWEQMDRFCSFQVERDVATLTPGELNMTVDLVCSRVDVVSAIDGSTCVEDPEFSWSARAFLKEVLDKVQDLESPRKLVALREGEKVLVFDK